MTDDFTDIFAFLGSTCVKVARKALMKLTPGGMKQVMLLIIEVYYSTVRFSTPS